jgi:hypothetical protein
MHAGKAEQAGSKAGQSKQSGSQAEQRRELSRADRQTGREEQTGTFGRPVSQAVQRMQAGRAEQAGRSGYPST